MEKDYYMFLKKLIKTYVVDLGFLQSVNNHISNKNFYQEIYKSRASIIKNFKTTGVSYESFFIWAIYYQKLSDNLFNVYFLEKKISLFFFIFSKIIKNIFFILDSLFLIAAIFFLKISFPKVKKLNKRALIVFTKDKQRENFYKYFPYNYFDLFLEYKLFKYKVAINCNFLEIYKILRFKFCNKSIRSSIILHVYYFKIYFDSFLLINKDNSIVLIREGMSPITKMIYEVAIANNVESRIYLNTLIYNTNSFFPVHSVLLQHKSSDYYNLLRDSNKRIINDNPNINWRLYRRTIKNENIIGIILGDFFNRRSLQKIIDTQLFKSIKKFEDYAFILRPHPQESSDQTRIAYYNNLVDDCKNVSIDNSFDPSYFISNCSLVIATCSSTLIEECAHSGIIVFRYKLFNNTDINDDFFRLTDLVHYDVNNKNIAECLNRVILSRKKVTKKNFFSGKPKKFIFK
jgi:hypothetical protein